MSPMVVYTDIFQIQHYNNYSLVNQSAQCAKLKLFIELDLPSLPQVSNSKYVLLMGIKSVGMS